MTAALEAWRSYQEGVFELGKRHTSSLAFGINTQDHMLHQLEEKLSGRSCHKCPNALISWRRDTNKNGDATSRG